MWAKITSESVKSNNNTATAAVYINSPITHEPMTTTTPTDLISAAHHLLPHQSPTTLHDSLSRANVNTTPYDHIDTPSRPIPHSKSYPEVKRGEKNHHENGHHVDACIVCRKLKLRGKRRHVVFHP